MTKLRNPASVRNDISTVLNMWENNPDLALPDVDLNAYKQLVEQFQDVDDQIRQLDNQRYVMRVKLETLSQQMGALHTRLRSFTRAFFGPNAPQMKQIGLIREAERKNPTRKLTADPTSTSVAA